MTEQEEKKNKRIGMAVSLGVHLAVVLLFAFLMAWREPNPPLPEYGIELNFGLDETGTGEAQPLTPSNESESLKEAAPDEQIIDPEAVDEVDVNESEPASREVPESVETFDDPESVDVSDTETAVVENVVEADQVTAEAVEEVTPQEPLKKEVEETSETTEGAQGQEGQVSEEEKSNQGDKTNQVGDQGDEQGEIDERALYGKPGGGGGPSLDLAGWTWDFEPNPNDPSDETGRIVFEIKIDDQGEIISIRTEQKTVSPTVELIYRKEVEKLTFSKTGNLPPAPTSTGKITFIIKSK